MNYQKLISGILTLISSIGASQIAHDLSDNCKNLIDTNLFRKIVIFSIIYNSTKDFQISFLVLAIYLVVVNVIFVDSDYLKECKHCKKFSKNAWK